MVDTSTLIACLEEYMFLASREASGLYPVSYAGVRGHRSGIAAPLTNLVGVAAPRVTIPERSMDAVFAEFGERNLPFTWLVGPHSLEGTASRLRRRGMIDFQELCGLAAFDVGARGLASPARIREVSTHEQKRFERLLTEMFELECEVAGFLARYYLFAATLRTRNYFAFVGDDPDPAAIASSVYDPESPVVILAIAAVRPQFRGRGLYKHLVQRRLADAKGDGCTAAVVHALPVSSAPICRRVGFREICTQELLCLAR